MSTRVETHGLRTGARFSLSSIHIFMNLPTLMISRPRFLPLDTAVPGAAAVRVGATAHLWHSLRTTPRSEGAQAPTSQRQRVMITSPSAEVRRQATLPVRGGASEAKRPLASHTAAAASSRALTAAR